jgi:hypothetical protein
MRHLLLAAALALGAGCQDTSTPDACPPCPLCVVGATCVRPPYECPRCVLIPTDAAMPDAGAPDAKP